MKRITYVDTTEEMVPNPDALPEEMRDGWRYCRVEYHGEGPWAVRECGLWFPRYFDRDAFERLFEEALEKEAPAEDNRG